MGRTNFFAKLLAFFICCIGFLEASFCGESSLPYHLKILPNNDLVLGCAKPTCFNFPSGASPHFSALENGDFDGFKITPKNSQSSLNITENIECDEQFGAGKCVEDGEWIGGIHPRPMITDENFQLSFRCCRNSAMKKAKFFQAFDLKANEEFEDGGDIYERGKLIGFDYISNIIQFETDQGVNYEIFVNRMLCNTVFNDVILKPTTKPKTLFKSALEFKGTNKNNEKNKLYQVLLAETDNANNVGDLQNINENENGNAGGGASSCASCPTNIQILTGTGQGPNAPVTQTPGTDTSGCSTITVNCSAVNPASQVSLIWQGQGVSGGTTLGTGSAFETLTCNTGGQYFLNQLGAINAIEQVECISPEALPPPLPQPNFQAPPQIVQQPFVPQQQPIVVQGGAGAAPVQYSAPTFGALPGWSPSFASCFSADTFVTTAGNNKKRMDELKVGEWILSGDSTTKEIGFSKISSWIHKKPNLMAEFLKFTLENGQHLKITKKHYIYRGDCKNENATLSSNSNLQMVFAESVTLEDCIFTLNEQNELISTKISKIENIQEKGIYAPLTVTGNLIVNDIFASCYSNVKDKPMQKYFPSFTGIIKNILSFLDFRLSSSMPSSSSSSKEFDLIPGINLLINILKDVLPQKY